ncbi:MAG: ABC transporter permease, partial [Streptomyces sp.]|nr:ABC transporter permease [Streptomyces sp.]
MSAATATATAHPITDDARIPLRAHLRHTGALIRRNLLWIRKDPESMADALLMP